MFNDDNMLSARKRIPSLLLEKWRLGELSQERKDSLIREFGKPFIEESLKILENDEKNWQKFSIKKELSQNIRRTLLMLTPLLTAALALFFIYTPQIPEIHRTEDTILLKGGEGSLRVFRQSTGESMELKDKDRGSAGDLVQLSFRGDNFKYAAVFSIDSRGQVTRHWPEQIDGRNEIDSAAPVRLSNTFLLDNAPQFERFVLIRSDEPFSVAELESKLSTLDHVTDDSHDSLLIDSKFDQTSVVIIK